MTANPYDLTYAIVIDGQLDHIYDVERHAIRHAKETKTDDPGKTVVVVVLTAEDADMTADDYRKAPLAIPPMEQAREALTLVPGWSVKA